VVSLLTPSRIATILRDSGLRPRQTLGQNFLADPNKVRHIVSLARVGSGDKVLEVGPGLGSLTMGLVEAGAEVVAIETDPRLAELCRHLVPQARVVTGDALRIDLAALVVGEGWCCVSNLPYNVAVPLVMRVLEEVRAVERLLVMVQAEVGERMVARPGDRARGAVTVKIEYHASSRIEGRVSPRVFVPEPSVDSVLVSLARRAPPAGVSRGKLFEVIDKAFGQRRKMLRSSLLTLLGSPERAEATLRAARVDPTVRPEALSLQEFVDIAEQMS
jgi:16S rRNA (adenine1518-N6/adenine1519-N6)-dimethyltransferase